MKNSKNIKKSKFTSDVRSCRTIGTIIRGSVSFTILQIFWLIRVLCWIVRWFPTNIMMRIIPITCNTDVYCIILPITNISGCIILIWSRRRFAIQRFWRTPSSLESSCSWATISWVSSVWLVIFIFYFIILYITLASGSGIWRSSTLQS